jgi:hypothetical protein
VSLYRCKHAHISDVFSRGVRIHNIDSSVCSHFPSLERLLFNLWARLLRTWLWEYSFTRNPIGRLLLFWSPRLCIVWIYTCALISWIIASSVRVEIALLRGVPVCMYCNYVNVIPVVKRKSLWAWIEMQVFFVVYMFGSSCLVALKLNWLIIKWYWIYTFVCVSILVWF